MLSGPAVDAAGRLHRHGGFRGAGLHQDPERAKRHLGLAAEWVYDRVDATDAQKQDAKSVLSATVDFMVPIATQHRENREAMVTILSSDPIDRSALEELRQSELSLADSASTGLLDALVELAETLTPAQRAELVEMAERFRH